MRSTSPFFASDLAASAAPGGNFVATAHGPAMDGAETNPSRRCR